MPTCFDWLSDLPWDHETLRCICSCGSLPPLWCLYFRKLRNGNHCIYIVVWCTALASFHFYGALVFKENNWQPLHICCAGCRAPVSCHLHSAHVSRMCDEATTDKAIVAVVPIWLGKKCSQGQIGGWWWQHVRSFIHAYSNNSLCTKLLEWWSFEIRCLSGRLINLPCHHHETVPNRCRCFL